jgi:iron complex outermembrane recepter protein
MAIALSGFVSAACGRVTLNSPQTGGYDQKASAVATAAQSRVDAYEQFDIYLGWSGIENLTLYTKVENLFDEEPPYDASFPGIRAPYDFTQYDLRGRGFLIGLDYKL